MIKLRPHHLLCTQAYEGKGYSDDFTKNMTLITNRLRSEKNIAVQIVFWTDDICAKCPNMAGENCCVSDEKVQTFDTKVCAYFGIEEKIYIYQEITGQIHSKMTAEIMDDICGVCAWYAVSACKSKCVKNPL